MIGFLNEDSGFTMAVRHVMFFGITNVLWLLCCIPVVTAGLSTTALFTCLNDYGQSGDPDAWRKFLPAFRANLRQGLIMGIAALLGCGLLVISGISVHIVDIPGKPFFVGAIILAGCLLLTILIYFFPLLAQFHNRISEFVRIGCIIGFRHFAATLLIPLYWGIVIFLCWVFPYLIPFWMLGGFTLAFWLINQVYHRIFVRYGAPEWNRKPGNTEAEVKREEFSQLK